MRFLFVSLIARYQLCNQHGEGVLDGLVRLHPAYAPILFVAAIVMGHVYGVVHDPRDRRSVAQRVRLRRDLAMGARVERAGAVSGLSTELPRAGAASSCSSWRCCRSRSSAARSGSASIPRDVARGLVRMEMPGRQGVYDPWRVALAMIGAVGGSLMNLVYPYFLDAKGWRGPQYRRVQLYDFLLGIAAMLVLNLAVWVLGAELLYPDRHIEHLEDLPNLLSNVARRLRAAAVLRGDLLGHLHVDHRPRGRPGLARHACLAADARRRRSRRHRFSRHPCYRWIAIGCLVPPLIWTMPGMPGFVRADAGRQQRAGRPAADAGGRAVVDHRERAPDRAASTGIAGGRTP